MLHTFNLSVILSLRQIVKRKKCEEEEDCDKVLQYGGGLGGMWEECVDILKWQWENNEALLIGGWEPHRDVASHCSRGPRGHKRLPIWRKIRRIATGKTGRVDSGRLQGIEIQRRVFFFCRHTEVDVEGHLGDLRHFIFPLHLMWRESLMHDTSPEFISNW